MRTLTSHSGDWLPVRLRDDRSLRHLEMLLRDGWFLMHLGVDGLEALAFAVDSEPPTAGRRMFWQRDRTEGSETVCVVVLRRGDRPDRQRLIVTRRDDDGHLDMRIRVEAGWRVVTVVQIESGDLVTFVEAEGEERA